MAIEAKILGHVELKMLGHLWAGCSCQGLGVGRKKDLLDLGEKKAHRNFVLSTVIFRFFNYTKAGGGGFSQPLCYFGFTLINLFIYYSFYG